MSQPPRKIRSVQGGFKIEFCVLASGSRGNSIYIGSGETEILIDSGLSARELKRRLDSIGKCLDSVSSILVSHEHSDHTHSLRSVSSRFDTGIYQSCGTAAAQGFSSSPGGGKMNTFQAGDSFTVGGLEIKTFPVPHDAAEPVGFTISDGKSRLGVATDLGCISLEVLAGLLECDALIIESNHDEKMLALGPYPAFLKKRVSGPLGHLSNRDAGELIGGVVHNGLKHLVLAHLSQTNNNVNLSTESAMRALGLRASRVSLSVGCQSCCGDLITV